MRRAIIASMSVLAALLGAPVAAQAAPPSLGAVSATDIQGVSALLKGTVDPESLSTTYYFEYSTQANFSGAAKTSTEPAGSGNEPKPARAAIAGLKPDTLYHYRLVATSIGGNVDSGLSNSFTTTHGFGFLPGTSGFAANASTDGAAATQADSHPYELDFTVGLNQGGEFEGQPGAIFPDGDLRDLSIEMPPGLVANPRTIDECSLAKFHTPRNSPFETSLSSEACPDRTQVGTADVKTSLGGGQTRRFGLFNLHPPPGIAAQVGFSAFGSPIVFNVSLRPGADGSYTMVLQATNVPQSLDLHGLGLSLWGTPWAASHDGERGNCLREDDPGVPWAKCSVGEPITNPPLAFLTLPSACSGPLSFSVRADAWQQPAEVSASAVNRVAGGQPAQMSCAGLSFNPKPVGQLTDTKASSPSGYNFQLTVDNATLTNPGAPAPPPTREAIVNLPAGVTINPSVGAGLGVCTPGQYAAETAFSAPGGGCPNASKIGDFEVRAALFDTLLEGAVYLAEPDDPATGAPGAENPFDTLAAVYLVAKLPARGVLVKLPGRIVPSPTSGDLVATFSGLPQLPYTELNLTFRTGQRAFLITPPTCGTATTIAHLTSWASSVPAKHETTSSTISSGIAGGPCPSGAPPFAPGVSAGGVNSNVNSFTPYFVHLTRRDTEQEITSYSLDLPEGITGKLAGIPFCPDAAIEAARHRRGTAEEASPSCPVASQVGHTSSGYGVGNSLTYTSGRIYLAGPYNGRPLSLVAINPATVGPFDLGNVVIRSAFSVDPHTARLRIDAGASDRIPHILDGIVLHLRDIRIYMDRPEFTHNPSSCAPSELVSTLTGAGSSFESAADDSTATGKEHFQLLNCGTVGFRPKLGVRLRGGTKRRAYPQLRVTFVARGSQDTNLKEIAVSMPHSEFFAQEHIKGICTKVQFNSETCPADSVYGRATAYTPLFDDPLTGPVYLRSSSKQIPDLVASLHSGAVHIILEGAIGGTKQGGIKALFKDLPDEPLEKFVMVLNGGKRGLLQNSSDICAEPPLATVKALGQSNLGAEFTSTLRGQCHKTQRRHRHRGKSQHKRGNR